MHQERLYSPKELAEAVGLSTAQIRMLMNDRRLEFIQVSSKTKKITLGAWERFQRNATQPPNPNLRDKVQVPLSKEISDGNH
jgi:hypothetical protein